MFAGRFGQAHLGNCKVAIIRKPKSLHQGQGLLCPGAYAVRTICQLWVSVHVQFC